MTKKQKEKKIRRQISAGHYKLSLSMMDYNTERNLLVTDKDGNKIGERDPFYPSGIPVNIMQRQAKIIACAVSIISDSIA